MMACGKSKGKNHVGLRRCAARVLAALSRVLCSRNNIYGTRTENSVVEKRLLRVLGVGDCQCDMRVDILIAEKCRTKVRKN